MRWVFCINFRGLYLASEGTPRDAVFAARIFERGRTRQSDKNRGSIIRVTGPLILRGGMTLAELLEEDSDTLGEEHLSELVSFLDKSTDGFCEYG